HPPAVRRDPEEVPRGGQGRSQRLLRPHAGRPDVPGGPVSPGGDRGRRVPVHGRLLRTAEPGAAPVATVEAGPGPGNPRVPAAGPQAGVNPAGLPRINRGPRPISRVYTPNPAPRDWHLSSKEDLVRSMLRTRAGPVVSPCETPRQSLMIYLPGSAA